jgi:hypothetical protein
VVWSLRLTLAAVASYVVATLLFPDTVPLIAPLTAMLVVQVTPVSLLASGIDRVVAVVAGVSLAVLFADRTPLVWWSLGLLILASLLIGQLLMLRANLIEVPISAMLVLGVGSFGANYVAWQRITETLVGAAVGVAANLLFPPKVGAADAGRAIDGLADAVSDLLLRAADELEELVRDRDDLDTAADEWLGEARRITHELPEIGAALLRAEEGRRLNVRAAVTADAGPGLRQGLEALEHATVSIRGLFRAVYDAAHATGWPDDTSAEDLFLDVARTFRDLAAGTDAFGQLVRDDAGPSGTLTSADARRLQDARAAMHDAGERLEASLLTLTAPEQIELNVFALSTVKRLLSELDLDSRIRRQVQLRRRTRSPLAAPVARRRRRRRSSAEPRMDDAETEVMSPIPDEAADEAADDRDR